MAKTCFAVKSCDNKARFVATKSTFFEGIYMMEIPNLPTSELDSMTIVTGKYKDLLWYYEGDFALEELLDMFILFKNQGLIVYPLPIERISSMSFIEKTHQKYIKFIIKHPDLSETINLAVPRQLEGIVKDRTIGLEN